MPLAPQEVDAAREISQRGIMLVATAHGTDLRSLLKNAELNQLVGGVQSVTLGDAVAATSNQGVKTKVERRGAPAFDVVVELLGGRRYAGPLTHRLNCGGRPCLMLWWSCWGVQVWRGSHCGRNGRWCWWLPTGVYPPLTVCQCTVCCQLHGVLASHLDGNTQRGMWPRISSAHVPNCRATCPCAVPCAHASCHVASRRTA